MRAAVTTPLDLQLAVVQLKNAAALVAAAWSSSKFGQWAAITITIRVVSAVTPWLEGEYKEKKKRTDAAAGQLATSAAIPTMVTLWYPSMSRWRGPGGVLADPAQRGVVDNGTARREGQRGQNRAALEHRVERGRGQLRQPAPGCRRLAE